MNSFKLQRGLLLVTASWYALAWIGLHEVNATESIENPIETDRRPNVIVLLSDDQGWGDFGFQGNTNFQTPNLDQLATSGAVCQRFYVCPVCAPTRAEFLTGRYHPRGSALGVTQGDERLDLDEITLANRLKQAGYATGAFGKWHNGSQYPYHPNARGFDEFYGFCSGHWGDYFSPPLELNGQAVRGEGFVADDFTNRALEFIECNKDKPFFCYLAFNTPHSPMQVPDEFWDRVRDRKLTMQHRGRPGEKEDEPTTQAAIAMVENIDWNVGRIVQLLSELKLRQETIIVYFNDNGPNSFRWNAGMKGRKGTLDEGGMRSPLLMSWPGKIPASHRVEQLCGAIDITPTLCELMAIDVTSDPEHPLDGISIAPQLLTPQAPTQSRTLFGHWNGRIALRQDQYLLAPEGGLYHLIQDPTQQSDLSASQPERVAAMSAQVERWREEVLRSAQLDRPFLVGHPNRPIAQLPAQDGKCKGPSVKRSDTAPNCSFFTNIRSTDDRIFWDVESLTSGNYQISIHYTASQSTAGSKLKLRFGQQELIGRIENAYDSQLHGQQNDRVPRKSESLMKDFQQTQLGTINLPAQRANLEIRLQEPIPEDGSIEIQAVEFQLLTP